MTALSDILDLAPPALARPMEAGAARLYVCTTCRAPDDVSDEPAARGGARLARALESEARSRGADIEIVPVECLSVCKRPGTVALAAPGKWTYVIGDLDPGTSAPAILDGAALYALSPDGIVPWRERPQAFRKGVVSRVPPLPTLPETDR